MPIARLHPLAAAAAPCRLACAAHAETGAALPAVNVTATMTEQDARPAPSNSTVITAEELAERNASDLLDAVRRAPCTARQA